MSASAFFAKRDKIRDELRCIFPLPTSIEDLEAYMSTLDLMLCLMGLSETYDAVRSQILLMDLMSNTDQVYSMIATVEKQHQLQGWMPGNSIVVLATNRIPPPRSFDKKKG